MTSSKDDALCDMFEMLVTRLTNVEETSAAIMDVLRFNMEIAPVGSRVPPVFLGRNIQVTKQYDGSIQDGNQCVVVGVDGLLDSIQIIETLEWASGRRLDIDDAVEAVIGKTVADEARRLVHERHLADPASVEDILAVDVGLKPTREFSDFTTVWWITGILRLVPEVVAINDYHLLIRVGARWVLKDVFDIVAKVYSILGKVMNKTWEYTVHRIPRALAPFVVLSPMCFKMQKTWDHLDAKEKEAVYRVFKPWNNMWLKSAFEDVEELSTILDRYRYTRCLAAIGGVP